MKGTRYGAPLTQSPYSITRHGHGGEHDNSRWSLSANEIDRYALRDRTPGLKKGADGSLELLIQKERPADISNWLPTPAGNFELVLRAYQPQAPILNGKYTLPPLEIV